MLEVIRRIRDNECPSRQCIGRKIAFPLLLGDAFHSREGSGRLRPEVHRQRADLMGRSSDASEGFDQGMSFH